MYEQKLSARDLVRFNEAFENSASGKRLAEALAGMNASDAARLTEAVTGAVADAVKRGESYSSRTDFLTDESVERMTEAVIAEAAEALGLADADDTAPTRETIRDSNVAALKDMAKEALTERFQKDGALRDTAERVRQARRDGTIRNPYDYLNGIPVKYYGNSVLFPPEYGIVYSDGKRYPVLVSPYSEAKPIIKQLGLPNTQAHHVAQNAIYGDIVLKSEGITISMEGNVFTDSGSLYNGMHTFSESKLDVFREAGTLPTNAEYIAITIQGLQSLGYNEVVVKYVMDCVSQQQLTHGLLPDMPIPKMPKKIYFGSSKTTMREDLRDESVL